LKTDKVHSIRDYDWSNSVMPNLVLDFVNKNNKTRVVIPKLSNPLSKSQRSLTDLFKHKVTHRQNSSFRPSQLQSKH
jgi:hypothetical protein